jgi:DNA-binding IclR family transcriptional regulator
MALQPSPSAQRAVAIVQFLAEHPDETLSVAELARRVGQSRATCQAVLLALESADWVRRREGGGYTLGAGLIAVGAAAARGAGVVELLRLAADEIQSSTGCEAIACLPAGTYLITVARAGPTDPFSGATTVGHAYPLAPPYGLAFVAWEKAEFDRWIARAPELDPGARGRLEEAAGFVRELGYSITLDSATRWVLGSAVDDLADDERAEVLAALAHDDYVAVDPSGRRTMRVSHLSAPVFGPDGRVIALMGVNVGADDASRLPEIAATLCTTARRLSDELQTPGAPARTPLAAEG